MSNVTPPESGLEPVIVIGAPRSGTNLVRDLITEVPGLETWPCDEINPIWRHGHLTHPSDEFEAEQATPDVSAWLRRAFDRQHRRSGGARVVEKTCANSLRVAFVDRVFPEARYVFLVRDGRDATASALKRWSAPMELGYVLRKARFVPPSDLAFYARRYLANRAHRLRGSEGRVARWGPRFEGMDTMLREEPLEVVCATQWSRCVDRADEAFRDVDPSRVLRLRYEELAGDPVSGLHDLFSFVGATDARSHAERLAARIRSDGVGKWRSELTPEQATRVQDAAARTLEAQGYR